MTTTTSYSNQTRFLGLYRSTLRRNLGIITIFSLVVLVFFPLQYLLEVMEQHPQYDSYCNLIGVFPVYNIFSVIIFAPAVLLMPLLLGISLNAYMHSKKAVDLYHSLPVGRGTLLSANLATAMTIIAVPVAVGYLLVGLIQGVAFGFSFQFLLAGLADFVSLMILCFAIYSLATIVSVCVGTAFDATIFTLGLLAAPPVLILVTEALFEAFLYGYVPGEVMLVRVLVNSTPVVPIFLRMAVDYNGTADLMAGNYNFFENSSRIYQPLWHHIGLLVWLVIGVLLYLGALALYRRRRSETAESTSTSSVITVIIKVIGGYLGALTMGAILSLGVGGGSGSKLLFLLGAVIGYLLVHLIIEAVVARGFKTVLRTLPLTGGIGVVVVGFIAVVLSGGLGYETRVPTVDQVSEVTINYAGRFSENNRVRSEIYLDYDGLQSTSYYGLEDKVTLSGEAGKAVVIQAHQMEVDAHRQGATLLEGYEYNSHGSRIELTYRLKSGGTISRAYYLQGQAFELFNQLETNEEFLRQTSGVFDIQGEDVERLYYCDSYNSRGSMFSQTLTAAQYNVLLEALRSDLLLESYEEITHPTRPAVGYLRFEMKDQLDGSAYRKEVQLLIPGSYTQTIQVLKDLGLYDRMQPDLSKLEYVWIDCDPYSGYYYDDSMIQIVDPEGRETWPFEHAEEYGYDPMQVLKVEDEALIDQLCDTSYNQYFAKQVPVLNVYFHFRDQPYDICKFLPFDEAPAEVQDYVRELVETGRLAGTAAEEVYAFSAGETTVAAAEVMVAG